MNDAMDTGPWKELDDRRRELFDSYEDVHLDEGPIRLYRAGPVDAPTVVLLHGSMLDNAQIIWRHLAPALSSQWHVVVPDLPRHGGSRPWAGVVDQARMERVIDGLLDHHGLSQVALVGLSMGGGIATGYALSRPERVSALVAIGPGAIEDSRPGQFLTWLLTRSSVLMRWGQRLLNSRKRMNRTMADGHTHGEDTRDFAELMDLIMTEVQEGIRHREGALDDWQIAMFGPRKMRVNFTPQLTRLAVPSLWLHGEHDDLPGIREHLVRRAAGLAPGGRFESIPDAGHWAPLDEPERVYRSVSAFLSEVHSSRAMHPRTEGEQPDRRVA